MFLPLFLSFFFSFSLEKKMILNRFERVFSMHMDLRDPWRAGTGADIIIFWPGLHPLQIFHLLNYCFFHSLYCHAQPWIYSSQFPPKMWILTELNPSLLCRHPKPPCPEGGVDVIALILSCLCSFPVAWKVIILNYSKITSHPFSLIVVITQLRCFLGLNLLHSTGEGKNTQGFTDDQLLKITAEETHWKRQENWQTAFLGFPGSLLMKIKHGQHYFWFPRPGFLGNSRPLNVFSKRKWPLAAPLGVQAGYQGEFFP